MVVVIETSPSWPSGEFYVVDAPVICTIAAHGVTVSNNGSTVYTRYRRCTFGGRTRLCTPYSVVEGLLRLVLCRSLELWFHTLALLAILLACTVSGTRTSQNAARATRQSSSQTSLSSRTSRARYGRIRGVTVDISTCNLRRCAENRRYHEVSFSADVMRLTLDSRSSFARTKQQTSIAIYSNIACRTAHSSFLSASTVQRPAPVLLPPTLTSTNRCRRAVTLTAVSNRLPRFRKKDYVFRSFWDRDECHSLLERLRLDADKPEAVFERELIASAAASGDECRESSDNVSFILLLSC